MEAFLTVQTHFAAAHRLAKEEISFDENKKSMGNVPELMDMVITILSI